MTQRSGIYLKLLWSGQLMGLEKWLFTTWMTQQFKKKKDLGAGSSTKKACRIQMHQMLQFQRKKHVSVPAANSQSRHRPGLRWYGLSQDPVLSVSWTPMRTQCCFSWLLCRHPAGITKTPAVTVGLWKLDSLVSIQGDSPWESLG